MEKTTLYLPDDLQRRLRDAARREGRSQAELVREALSAYLEDSPRPTPGSLGAGCDPDLPARDAEEWLESRWRERHGGR